MKQEVKKALPDSEIILRIAKALKIKKTSLALALGYKSRESIARVLRGDYPITDEMVNKIMEKFPEVNIHFLKTGLGEPLVSGDQLTDQNKIFGNYPQSIDPGFGGTPYDEIRLRLAQIEKDGLENKLLLRRIVEHLQIK